MQLTIESAARSTTAAFGIIIRRSTRGFRRSRSQLICRPFGGLGGDAMVGPSEIRVAQPGDAALLAQLNEVVHALHVENHPEVFRATDRSEVALWFGELLKDPAARAWIAFIDNAPVGYVLLLERHRPQNPFCWERRWFELDQICVLPEHRGQGIARTLTNEAKRYAVDRGALYMTVEAWAFNGPAQKTFKQLGFEPLSAGFRSALPSSDDCSGR
jgi:ribosomal protein S18 acetylase RimI-like enzyme